MVKRRFAYLFGAFLALSFAFGAIAAPAAPSIVVARTSGTVEVSHPKQTSGKWQAAKQGQNIGLGWKLRTGKGGKVQLTFPKNNTVILKENSVLYVDKLDDGGGGRVLTDKGGLLVQLKNALTPGSKFEVGTPAALATVRGTEFAVLLGSSSSGGGGKSDEATNDRQIKSRSGHRLVLEDEKDAARVGGVGQAGDVYEQHADAVAEKASYGGQTGIGHPQFRVKVQLHWDREGKNNDNSNVLSRLVDISGDGVADLVIADIDGDGKLDQLILGTTQVPGGSFLSDDYYGSTAGATRQGRKADDDSIDVTFGSGLGKTDVEDVEVRKPRVIVADLDDDGIAEIIVPGSSSDELLGLDGLGALIEGVGSARHKMKEGEVKQAEDAIDNFVSFDSLSPGSVEFANLKQGFELAEKTGGFNNPQTETNRIVDLAALKAAGGIDVLLIPDQNDASLFATEDDLHAAGMGSDGSTGQLWLPAVDAAKYTPPSTGFLTSTDGVPAQAETYLLKKEEGGRHTPFHNKYRPQYTLAAAGDVNGDGRADVIAADLDGDGALDHVVLSGGGLAPEAVGMTAHDTVKNSINNVRSTASGGDDDDDGKAEIAIKEQGVKRSEIAIKEQGVKIAIKEQGVKIADLDGDGVPDDFYGTHQSDNPEAVGISLAEVMVATGMAGLVSLSTAHEIQHGSLDYLDEYVEQGMEQDQQVRGQLEQQQNMLGSLGMATDMLGQRGTGTTPLGGSLSSAKGILPSPMGGIADNPPPKRPKSSSSGLPPSGFVPRPMSFDLLQIADLDQDGLDDYMVMFHNGPRQTTSQDGTFGHRDLSAGASLVTGDGSVMPSAVIIEADLDGDGDSESMAGVAAGDVNGDGISDYLVSSRVAIKTKGTGADKNRSIGNVGEEGDLKEESHFKEVTGLDVYIDTLEYQEGGKNDGFHKLPGIASSIDDLDGDGFADLIVYGGNAQEGGIGEGSSDVNPSGFNQTHNQEGKGRQNGALIFADFDGDGAVDALDDDSDGDGLADLAVGDINGDGVIDHAFLHDDVNGDGKPDYVVLTGFSNLENSVEQRKGSHDIALNSIRNMKGLAVTADGWLDPSDGGPLMYQGKFPGPMAPPMPNIPTPLGMETAGTEGSGEAAPRSNDRLRTAGPVSGWPSVFEDGSFEVAKAAYFLGVQRYDVFDDKTLERKGASTRDSDGLVFNVINPKAARDNHLQGGVDVITDLIGRTLDTDSDGDGVQDYLDDDDDNDGIDDPKDDDCDGSGDSDYDQMLAQLKKGGGVTSDGWNMLKAFDSNNDGKINANDPVFDKLQVTDTNGDGQVTAEEVVNFGVSGKPFVLDGSRSTDDGVVPSFFWKDNGDGAFQSDRSVPWQKAKNSHANTPDLERKGSKTYEDQNDQDVVHFYGYIHTVEVSNADGTQMLGEGQTIDALPGEAPSPPHESGPEADAFRQELKDEFKNGDIPNEDDFADIIDSKITKPDVGLGTVPNVIFNPKEYNIRLKALVDQAKQLLADAQELDQTIDNEQKGAIADALHRPSTSNLIPAINNISSRLIAVANDANNLAEEEAGSAAGMSIDEAGTEKIKKPQALYTETTGILIGLLRDIQSELSVFGYSPQEVQAPAARKAGGKQYDFANQLREADLANAEELDELAGHFDLWSELLNTLEGTRKVIGVTKWKNIVLKRGFAEIGYPDMSAYDAELDALITRAGELHTAAHEAAHVVQQRQGTNPLYEDQGNKGENPLFEEGERKFETLIDSALSLSDDAAALARSARGGFQSNNWPGKAAAGEQEEGFGRDIDQLIAQLEVVMDEVDGSIKSLQQGLIGVRKENIDLKTSLSDSSKTLSGKIGQQAAAAVDDFEKNTEGVSGGFGLSGGGHSQGGTTGPPFVAFFAKWDTLLGELDAVRTEKIKFKQEFGPQQGNKRTEYVNAGGVVVVLDGIADFDTRLDALVAQAHELDAVSKETAKKYQGQMGSLNSNPLYREGLPENGMPDNGIAQHNQSDLEFIRVRAAEIAAGGQALAEEESKAADDAAAKGYTPKSGQFTSADFDYKAKSYREAAEAISGALDEIGNVMAGLQSGGGGSGGTVTPYDFSSQLRVAIKTRGTGADKNRTAGGGGDGDDISPDEEAAAEQLLAHFDKWSDLANTLRKAKAWMVNNYEVHPVAALEPGFKWMAPEVLGQFQGQLGNQLGEVNNMRSRINELEEKLKSLGLLENPAARNKNAAGNADPTPATLTGDQQEDLDAMAHELDEESKRVREVTDKIEKLAMDERDVIGLVVATEGDGGGKAQDHNSSRSNKTASDGPVQLNQDGNSTSSNQKMSSSQPKIVENTKGLLVQFFADALAALADGSTNQWPDLAPTVEDDPSNEGLQDHLNEWNRLVGQAILTRNVLKTFFEIKGRSIPENSIEAPSFDVAPYEAALGEIEGQLDEAGQAVGAGQVIDIIERLIILNTAAEALGSSRDDFLPAVQDYANKYAMYGVMKGAFTDEGNPDAAGRITKPGMDKLTGGGGGAGKNIGELIKEVSGQSEASRAFLQSLQGFFDDADAEAAAKVNKVDAFTIKQKVAKDEVGEMRGYQEGGDNEATRKDYATDPYVETTQRYATDPYSEDVLRLIQHFVSVMDKLGELDAQFAQYQSSVEVRGWDPKTKRAILGTAQNLERISQEWDRYETHEQDTQLKFLWNQVLDLHDELHDVYEDFGDAVGLKVKEKANRTKCSNNLRTLPPVGFDSTQGELLPADIELPAVQSEFLPAVQSELLPAVQRWVDAVVDDDTQVRELHERMEEMQDEIDPLISSNEELRDQLRGLIDPGDPVLGTRFENMDTDNDGLSDVAEVALGLDPLASNDDGFIELVEPEDGEVVRRAAGTRVVFAFVPLDTDEPIDYRLVLEGEGQQLVRSNVREQTAVPLDDLVGTAGAFSDTDGDGFVDIVWHIEGRLKRQYTDRVQLINSQSRTLRVELPAVQHVIIDIDSASNIQRLGGDILIHGSISEVNNLGEWEIRVAYDPKVLQFERGRKLGIFGQATVFFGDQAGGVIVISGSAPRGSGGISGEGEIFELQFTALAAEDTVVEGQDATLTDTTGQDIETDFGNEADLSITGGGGAASVGRGAFDEKYR